MVQLKVIIYMLLNLIEEKCYVGQTIGTLTDRVQAHWDNAKGGSMTNIAKAMRKWDEHLYWDYVVLQRCTSVTALDAMETFWIDECSSRDQGIGYNMKHGSPERQRVEPMTDERREFFRECGRRGGAATKALLQDPNAVPKKKRVSPLAGMTDEEKRAYFSECGKRGAGKLKPRRPQFD